MRTRGLLARSVLLAAGLVAAGCRGEKTAEPAGLSRVELPDPATASGPPADLGWSLRSLTGETVPLERYAGKVLFVNVWATWCPPCREELPALERLIASLPEEDRDDIAFFLVTEESIEDVRGFLRYFRLESLPVFLAPEGIPEPFATNAIPATYVVDRRGRLVFRHLGSAAWDDEGVARFLVALARAETEPAS